MSAEHHALSAWASLRHGGLLLAPARIPELFPTALPPLSEEIGRAHV